MNEFEILTDTYNALIKCKQQVDDAVVNVEKQFKRGDLYFNNPIQWTITNPIDDALRKGKRQFIKFIIDNITESDDRYRNFIIDEEAILQHFKAKEYGEFAAEFDAEEIVRYVDDMYGTNLEEKLMQQITEIAKKCIPYKLRKYGEPLQSITYINTLEGLMKKMSAFKFPKSAQSSADNPRSNNQ